jgi:hypothetical protein
MGKHVDGVDYVRNSRSRVDLGSRFLEFSQYTIGMVVSLQVFQPLQGF